MHISSISYVESESIETFHSEGLKKWVKREQSATVFLNEDDDPNKGDAFVKQFVKEKLGANIQVATYSDDNLPTIYVDKGKQPHELTLEQQIRSCKSVPILKVYESMVKKDPQLQKAYNDTMSAIELHNL